MPKVSVQSITSARRWSREAEGCLAPSVRRTTFWGTASVSTVWRFELQVRLCPTAYTRDSTVEFSRVGERQCVLNSQLVHDGFGWKISKLNMLRIYYLSSRSGWKIGSWVTTADGWVGYTLPDATQNWLNMFSFQFFYQIRRQSSWATCEFNAHRRRRRDATRQRCVDN